MVIAQTVQRKVLEGLRGIGLNLYERNLYTALLIKKVATASELSELSRVPRARAYDVLESLEQKGFVIVQHGSPFKYVAVEPIDAFENLKGNVHIYFPIVTAIVLSVLIWLLAGGGKTHR